jgi:hypothetical protein
MAKVTYDKQLTAPLVIDPYNDFICEGWEQPQLFAEEMRAALKSLRRTPRYA